MNRIYFGSPALVLLAILGFIFLWIKAFATTKLWQAKGVSLSVRTMFLLRNAVLLIFLGIAVIGFLWPQLWNQQEVDLVAGIAWFVCWMTLTVALQLVLRRQRKLQKGLTAEAKAQ